MAKYVLICPDCMSDELVSYESGCHSEGHNSLHIRETYSCKQCGTQFTAEFHKSDSEPTHGYWTGLTTKDYAHAEGIPPNATDAERQAYEDHFNHITHCSVCFAMFDSRRVSDWKVCPFCASIMDLPKPEE